MKYFEVPSDLPKRLELWSVYYASVVSFQYHPRVKVEERLSLEHCASVADAMLQHTGLRGDLWRG